MFSAIERCARQAQFLLDDGDAGLARLRAASCAATALAIDLDRAAVRRAAHRTGG